MSHRSSPNPRPTLVFACAAGLFSAGLHAQPAREAVLAAAAPPASAASGASGAKASVLDAVTVIGTRQDGYTVPQTDAATKLPLSPRETPQSVTVITRERLDDQNLTSLRSVLDNTPGVYSNAYDTERVIFYSRGFMVDSLMIDGVPALPSFNTSSIDETLETAFYDRVEVVRGATGLMSGSGSPAASVNLIRKHAEARTPTVSLDLGAGSWRDRRAVVDAATPLTADGSVRARVVAVGEDTHSYQALYHKKKTAFYGIVDADLSPRTELSVGYDLQNNRPRSNTWGSFPLFYSTGQLIDWPRSVTTAPDWSYWDRKTQNVFAELRQGLGGGWTLHANANWRRYDEDLELFYVYGFPDPADGTGLTPYASKSRARTIEKALDLYATGPFELFGRKHEAVVGYNGSRARNVGQEYSVPDDLPDPGNIFRWDGSYPRPAFGTEPTPLQDIRTDQDGVYGALRLSLADRLKAIGGARYARWKIDSFYAYDTPPDESYGFHKVIPYAGLVWDVLPHYSAFASYTAIFKAQSDRDATGRYLPPIDGRSVEFGLKGEHFDRKLNSSLVFFDTRESNVATPVLDPETGSPVLRDDGSTVMRAAPGIRSRGFELELDGKLAREWRGTIGYTRYVIQDADKQPAQTFVPGTMLRAFVTWEPERWVPHLTLGAGVDWQSASSTTVGSPDGATTLRQGSFANVSLMARYAFSPRASLQVNASNLLDRRYWVLDQYDNTYYGAPANVNVTLRLTY